MAYASKGRLAATICLLLPLAVHVASSAGRQQDPGREETARVDKLIASAPRSSPKPVVSFVRWESGAPSESRRAVFNVDNRSEFPDELFEPAPSLPPCGLNRMAWRAWVYFVTSTRQRLYGFCGGSSNPSLRGIWFGGKVGSPAPKGVTVVIVDRQTSRVYQSDPLLIPDPKGP